VGGGVKGGSAERKNEEGVGDGRGGRGVSGEAGSRVGEWKWEEQGKWKERGEVE